MTKFILAILLLFCCQLRVRSVSLSRDKAINYVEQSVITPIVGEERYIVLVLARHGLANRLRSAADWYHIAVISGRTLFLAWTPTNDCNASFTDLFESSPQKLKILPFLLPIDGFEAISFLEGIARAGNVTHLSLTAENMWTDMQGSFVVERSSFMSDTKAS